MLLALGVSVHAALALYDPPSSGSAVVRSMFAQSPVMAAMHVAGGIVALLLGPFQFVTALRRWSLRLHRWVGRTYMAGILVGGVGGLWVAFHGVGGWIAHTGFILMALGWLGTAGTALWKIRSGAVAAHRRWMIRNYSLTFVAVTLRVMLGVGAVLGIDFVTVIQFASWSWIFNLAVAESIIAGLGRRRHTRRPIVA